mmetsp:Transcript_16955/g.57551  ORF Transcript_16955/g.57551 Transcript_16955/m.57551 type:complete len:356 (-) Transcript_16955:103-1170(-)
MAEEPASAGGPVLGKRAAEGGAGEEGAAGGKRQRPGPAEEASVLGIMKRHAEAFPAGVDVADPRLARFVRAVAESYRDNPYHCFTHAVDVMESADWLATRLNFPLDGVELLALLVAALVHDAGHVGLGNAALEEAGHDLALRFNALSPLEQNSCFLCFSALGRPVTAWLSDVNPKDYARFRRLVLAMVLATDLGNAATTAHVAQREAALVEAGFDASNQVHRETVLVLLLRAADVGSVMKPVPSFMAWGRRLFRELGRGNAPPTADAFIKMQEGFLATHATTSFAAIAKLLTSEAADGVGASVRRVVESMSPTCDAERARMRDFLEAPPVADGGDGAGDGEGAEYAVLRAAPAVA